MSLVDGEKNELEPMSCAPSTMMNSIISSITHQIVRFSTRKYSRNVIFQDLNRTIIKIKNFNLFTPPYDVMSLADDAKMSVAISHYINHHSPLYMIA